MTRTPDSPRGTLKPGRGSTVRESDTPVDDHLAFGP